MNKIIEVKINGSREEATEKAKNYLLSQGFKMDASFGNHMVFKRGNSLTNMVTFNPLNWKSRIEVELAENELKAIFDVDTSFQVITAKEEQLWKTFIENFKATVESGEDYTASNKRLIKETKTKSLEYVSTAFIGAIAVGVPAGIIGSFAGAPNIATYFAIGGAVSFMNYKIRKDRNNKVI